MAKEVSEAFGEHKEGAIQWIAVKHLSVVWAQAQRLLDEKHAQNIADNFDPEMFGVLSVTKPNGSGVHHLIDGHHRRVAIEKMYGPNEMVPCQVFDTTDPARAAQLFDHIQTGRKAVAPIELFKVRVTAGNRVETAVDKIVRNCGYRISSRDRHSDNNITCVSSLKSIYQSYGEKTLTETLNTISAIWGTNDNSAVQGNIVRGMGEFLAEYRDVDFPRLRGQIGGKYTPARLHGAAKAYRELHGGSMASAIKELMASTYNEGLRTAAKKLQKKAK